MHLSGMIGLMCVSLLWWACDGKRAESDAGILKSTNFLFDHGAVVRGDTSQKRIALIFTGGEHGEGTKYILTTLARKNIKASFFVTGDYLVQEELHPFLRRMIVEGYYVGPHSDSHPLYCSWEDRSRTLVTREFFRTDLQKNIADLREFGALEGNCPVYFIPPYEWYNEKQAKWAEEMRVILFNYSPGSGSNRDWIPEDYDGFVSSRRILKDILEYEQKDPNGLNGFLLLLHLGAQRQDKMFLLLGTLIEELAKRGYEFVRVDEMLAQTR